MMSVIIKYCKMISTSFCLQYDHTVQRVQAAKYLGLTISHSLSWSTHVSGIIGRATSALAFFQRNFDQCLHDVKIKCYLTYIYPSDY